MPARAIANKIGAMVLSITTLLALTASGVLAGLIGALVGVGGGIIVVPTLVIGFGVDIKIAIASSLVAVVASSTAASSVYVGKGLSNMRLGMILEIATTLGGICGGLLAVWIAPDLISMIFGALLIFIASLMLRDGFRRKTESPASAPRAPDSPLASSLASEYYDDFQKRRIAYTVRRLPLGIAVSSVAGVLSGLLGVGGGFIKVPAMNMGMNVPMKVATATSNLMIGVTAISSLFVYFARGFVQPLIAAPVAVGVVGGALIGTKIAARISPTMLKRVFSILLFFIAIQMILRSAGVIGGH